MAYLFCVAGMVAVSGCGDGESIWKSKGKVKVVATTTMVADLVRVIGGDEVEVICLMQDGINPHSYVSRPSDTMAMQSADVIFYSGLHLEGKMHEVLEKLRERGRAYAVTSKLTADDVIVPEEKFAGYADPHVWGDPGLWLKGVDVVVEVLSKKDAAHAQVYEQRGEAYKKQLAELRGWAQSRLDEIPPEKRYLVTSHDAFMYYERAYGLVVRAIDGLAPGDKGGPKKVRELVQFIKQKRLKTIFAESAANPKAVAAIAQEAGVKLSPHKLFADAAGKRGEMEEVRGERYDIGTYVGMIKHNINAIVEGLR